jgi:hypothetical protein
MSNSKDWSGLETAPVMTIDYISVRLNDHFDQTAALNYVNRKKVNEDGEVIGIEVEPHQWGFYFSGKDIITMAFRQGGEPTGVKLARRFGLRVTRLDISWDVPVSSSESGEKEFLEDHARIKKHFADLKKQPDVNLHDGTPKRNNLGWGASYWSRSNKFQFAIYGKRFLKVDSHNHYNYFIRREIRLSGDEANAAFDYLRGKGADDVEHLKSLYQAMVNQIFEPGFFDAGEAGTHQKTTTPAREKNGSKEAWARGTVAPSFIRHFYETGVRLWELLSDECEATIIANGEKEAAKIKLTSERRVERLAYLASEKVAKLQERASLSEEKAMGERSRESPAEN